MKMTKPALRKWPLALAVLAGMSTSQLSYAQAAQHYTDRSSFEATLSRIIVDDYENPAYHFFMNNAQFSAVRNETRYTSTYFDNLALLAPMNAAQTDHGYCAGCNGSYRLDFSSTSIANQQGGIFGFGMDYESSEAPVTALITYADGSTENMALPSTPWGFFGVTSARSISSVAFGLADGVPSSAIYLVQDNLTIGQAVSAVPEASELTMLVSGLTALAYLSRRRKARA